MTLPVGSPDVIRMYKKGKKEIAEGGTYAMNLAVGVHPENGPFFLLTVPNDLVHMDGKAMEWLLPLSDAKDLVELIIKGMAGLQQKLEQFNNSPSKSNH